jgi:AcrR family transcriptional regulator
MKRVPRASSSDSRAAGPEDHRVRTGAMRRERTRRKLLTAAMTVFAQRGLDAPVIEDFIEAAGVARGTFYNYFKTPQELLAALTCELSDEIVRGIEEVVASIPDPLKRMATACLIYMHLGMELPTWGEFVMRAGAQGEATGRLAGLYLPRDLELACNAGAVKVTTFRAAQDLVLASLSRAIHTVNAGHAPREHLRSVLELVLRGLGVSAAAAARFSQLPLPKIQLPAALLERRV